MEVGGGAARQARRGETFLEVRSGGGQPFACFLCVLHMCVRVRTEPVRAGHCGIFLTSRVYVSYVFHR